MRSLPRRSLVSPPRLRAAGTGRAAQCAQAEAMFGAEQPLVRVLRGVETAVFQMRLMAGAQGLGRALLLHASSRALAVLVAATLVQAALGLRLLVLVETRHDLCRALIVDGCAPGRLSVVDREWRRLDDPRHRARLARWFDEHAATASRPLARVPGSRPLFSVRVVRPLVAELREIGALLRSDAAAVPGVALAERVLTDPGSPLWGTETDALARELARVRFLLVQPRQ
jgi:hypothetical protein